MEYEVVVKVKDEVNEVEDEVENEIEAGKIGIIQGLVDIRTISCMGYIRDHWEKHLFS